jgi:hypothetical protein
MVPLGVLLGVILVGAIAFVAGVAVQRDRKVDLDAPPYDLTDLPPPPLPLGDAECECGRVVSGTARHIIGVRFTDDALLAGGPVVGGTAMSADFCPEHCPGGCDKGCPARVGS